MTEPAKRTSRAVAETASFAGHRRGAPQRPADPGTTDPLLGELRR
jgi:hypothetical protein